MKFASSYDSLIDPTGAAALARIPVLAMESDFDHEPDSVPACQLTPEETLEVNTYTYVHFYNGKQSHSIMSVPGARISLPLYHCITGGLYEDNGDAGPGCPLFDLTCTMTYTGVAPDSRVFRLDPAETRFNVFYGVQELCTKAAAMANAFALHTWTTGDPSARGNAYTCTDYKRLVAALETIKARHFTAYHTNWICPAQLAAWASVLDCDFLTRIADCLVVAALVKG